MDLSVFVNNGTCYLSAFENKHEIGVRYTRQGMCLLLQENGSDDRNGDTFNSHVIVIVMVLFRWEWRLSVLRMNSSNITKKYTINIS